MPQYGDSLCHQISWRDSSHSSGSNCSTRTLPQHSLTHHHVENSGGNIWPENIAGRVLGTIPPPLSCMCIASVKPYLNSECCKEEPTEEFRNPNLKLGAKPFYPLAANSSENDLNLDCPSKH